MLPIKPEFRRGAVSTVFAKGQKQYLPLSANFFHPYVETKWKLSWKERLRILVRGTLYLTLMTFGQPLQPIKLSTERMEEQC